MISLTPARRYGFAVIGVLLIVIVRQLLDPILKDDLPFFLFVIPIILAGWAGGLWPGLMATGLSLLLGKYLFITPRGSVFRFERPADLTQALGFGFGGIALSILVGVIRKAERALHESRRFVQHVIDVSPSVIYVYDIRQRQTVFISRGLASTLGYPSGPDGQQQDFIRSVMHPDDSTPFLAHLERLTGSRDQETSECEYRMRHSSGEWRWFHSRDNVFTRNADGSVREIIGTATDITERKDAEEKTNFMANLNEALLPVADPEEIMKVAVRMLGEYLGVERCGYAEVDVDEDQFVVLGEYIRGPMPKIVGRYRMSEFGDDERKILRENRPYVVNDIESEATAGTDLELYRRGGIRALVCVPLNKGGRFMARMAVHQSTPRRWSRQEVNLIIEVANRCWESVERARAIRGLKESDQRYRAFIANSSEAIWRFELDQPIPLTLPEDEQIDLIYRYAYVAECNDAMARKYGYKDANQIIGARIGNLVARSNPQNIAFLQALVRSGYRLTNLETHETAPRGTEKYFLTSVIGIQERDAIVRAWGTQRDITDQKKAEAAVRTSEERLRRITDATQDALWEIDLKTNQLWWSEGARPLFGQGPGELKIGLEDWYNAIHPEDVQRVRALFEQFLRDDGREWHDEYRFRRADGSFVYIRDRGRKLYDDGAAVRIAGAMMDISESKRAEDALSESEERYRLLTALSPDGVVIVAADGTIHFMNPSMLRMLGLSSEHEIKENFFDYIVPESLDHCRDCMKTLMTQDAPATEVEAVFRSTDDRHFPVEVNAVRFEWKGQPFVQIVVRDISGHKQAEAERTRLMKDIESERDRLTQILEQMPIGVAIAEAPSGRTLFHNHEAVRLLRHPLLPSENYQGFAQYGGLHDDGSSYTAEEYPMARSLLLGSVIKSEEVRYLRGDSTETFLSVSSTPIYDPEGRMVLIVGTFMDIAERKQAEEALRESEERFAKAFRSSPSALVISRLSDGMILEVNDSFVSLTGFSRDEMIGKSTLELGLYANPSDRHRALAILNKENHLHDFELAMKRKSGERRLISMSAEPLNLRGERCWLTIGYDITERRLAEQERDRLLRQEKAAREEAEAANRMKDEFLATISHELRTPLTSILGWASMLSDRSLDESQTRRALQVIEQNARAQARLVDDILDASRIITGRLKLDAQLVDIERVFQAALDVIRPSAEAKRITLRVVIEAHEAMVLGDANRLQQVIWNILNNAVKFTNENGAIEARVRCAGSQVEISISDTGIGIEPQFQPYIFDRFRQADSTSTRKYGGLGLGLAIVRHLTEMHGGSVSVSSQGVSHGSTFTARFPIASVCRPPQSEELQPESEPDEQRHPHPPQHRLDGVRVLIIEDDPDTLAMLRFILDKSGAEVSTAASANEALHLLDVSQPDALVSDLAMPDRDGYELIREVRSRGPKLGGDIPAVALSAYTRAEDRLRAISAGFQVHVGKPVDPETLVDLLANLTGHNHS